jgi:hypothetical protein
MDLTDISVGLEVSKEEELGINNLLNASDIPRVYNRHRISI